MVISLYHYIYYITFKVSMKSLLDYFPLYKDKLTTAERFKEAAAGFLQMLVFLLTLAGLCDIICASLKK